tara:strand:- start:17103 stop:17645 length:543 start_codon:yes stop_codon:yes gene_type:complete
MSLSAAKRVSTTLSLPLRVADLPNRAGIDFQITPDAPSRKALADRLDLVHLRKLTFSGGLRPEGRHDWRLEGVLGATVVQTCVITQVPVTTRIDTPVTRLFLRKIPVIEAAETEMPDDDTVETLTPELDPGAVMAEALSIALPDYPRADGARIPDAYSDPGSDERPNPFAALAALRGKDT